MLLPIRKLPMYLFIKFEIIQFILKQLRSLSIKVGKI